jgi:hypothetical protein
MTFAIASFTVEQAYDSDGSDAHPVNRCKQDNYNNDDWDNIDNGGGNPREEGRGFDGAEVPQIQRQRQQLRHVCAVLKPQGVDNLVPPGITAHALQRQGRRVRIPILDHRIWVRGQRGGHGGQGGGQ